MDERGTEKLQILDFSARISCFRIDVFEMVDLEVPLAPSSPWL